jgi:RNA polymerase sigma-70 factor (ECF subfamily)
MGVLGEALQARASGPLAAELLAVPEVEARLRELVETGRRALPEARVTDAQWAAFLARHLVVGAAARMLEELRADDAHLALACLGGHPAAHRRLDERLRSVAGQALAGMRLGPSRTDELVQSVRTKLLVGDGAEAKLATYGGRGPLDAWLRVSLARSALSMLRSPDPRSGDAGELDDLHGDDDPRLAALRARCGPLLKRAVEQAARELPAPDRALLRLHFLDGLTIDDLAAVYHVHRATAARRLARARNTLTEKARARAMEALGVQEEELASLMGVMLSRLDVTLHRVLDSSEPGRARGTEP